MKMKKLAAIGIIAFTLISPFSITGCMDKEETVIEKTVPVPVIVPDRGKIDVNVHTDTPQAPSVIHKDTNTTVEKNYDSGAKTETKTQSTTVH